MCALSPHFFSHKIKKWKSKSKDCSQYTRTYRSTAGGIRSAIISSSYSWALMSSFVSITGKFACNNLPSPGWVLWAVSHRWLQYQYSRPSVSMPMKSDSRPYPVHDAPQALFRWCDWEWQQQKQAIAEWLSVCWCSSDENCCGDHRTRDAHMLEAAAQPVGTCRSHQMLELHCHRALLPWFHSLFHGALIHKFLSKVTNMSIFSILVMVMLSNLQEKNILWDLHDLQECGEGVHQASWQTAWWLRLHCASHDPSSHLSQPAQLQPLNICSVTCNPEYGHMDNVSCTNTHALLAKQVIKHTPPAQAHISHKHTPLAQTQTTCHTHELLECVQIYDDKFTRDYNGRNYAIRFEIW